ncbi:formamidopyrimidine/5-formyluracil/ 5-hydroxymethyluracil DNA glycosylase, partial [Pseudomonas syringae pv. actinidiae ICMP 18883]
DGERLYQRSRGKSIAVKPFIMDNAVVVGVGNIYATEALFAAGIDPRREAGGISRARYLKLAIEIKRILAYAIERGGTTLRDFIGGDGCLSTGAALSPARFAVQRCARSSWASAPAFTVPSASAERLMNPELLA